MALSSPPYRHVNSLNGVVRETYTMDYSFGEAPRVVRGRERMGISLHEKLQARAVSITAGHWSMSGWEARRGLTGHQLEPKRVLDWPTQVYLGGRQDRRP